METKQKQFYECPEAHAFALNQEDAICGSEPPQLTRQNYEYEEW